MSKVDVIEVEGVVVEALPNAMFKVKLENDHIVLAHVFQRQEVSVLLYQLAVIVVQIELESAELCAFPSVGTSVEAVQRCIART